MFACIYVHSNSTTQTLSKYRAITYCAPIGVHVSVSLAAIARWTLCLCKRGPVSICFNGVCACACFCACACAGACAQACRGGECLILGVRNGRLQMCSTLILSNTGAFRRWRSHSISTGMAKGILTQGSGLFTSVSLNPFIKCWGCRWLYCILLSVYWN